MMIPRVLAICTIASLAVVLAWSALMSYTKRRDARDLAGEDAALYVSHDLAFLARHAYVNAWGISCVKGTLFNLEDGTIQRDAIATCNMPAPEREIVTGVMAQLGRGQ